MTQINGLHRRWRRDADYKEAMTLWASSPSSHVRSLMPERRCVSRRKVKTPRHASHEPTRKRASID